VRLTKKVDESGSRASVRYVMNVNLVAKRWLIAQQSFDPRAFDAMEFARPDGRVQKRGWEQEELVFHERTSISDGLARSLARSVPHAVHQPCHLCLPNDGALKCERPTEGREVINSFDFWLSAVPHIQLTPCQAILDKFVEFRFVEERKEGAQFGLTAGERDNRHSSRNSVTVLARA
jgi:hypothetical protein